MWPLFLSAFVSSTLFPGGSEAVLYYLLQQAENNPWTLILVATAGNTLGGMTSWGLGRLIAIKYPAEGLVRPDRQKALARIERWGSPVLLLSWLPIVGDPLCVAAGWLRIHWLLSLVYIGMGKFLRYGVIVYFLA